MAWRDYRKSGLFNDEVEGMTVAERFIERLKGLELTPEEGERIIAEVRIRIRYPRLPKLDYPSRDCAECKKRGFDKWEWIDQKIIHDNGHAWPGFAGEPR